MIRSRLRRGGLASLLVTTLAATLPAFEQAPPGFAGLAGPDPASPLSTGLEVGSVRYRFTVSPDEEIPIFLGEPVAAHRWLLLAFLEAGGDRTRTRVVMRVAEGSYRVFEAVPSDVELTFERFDGLQNPVEAWFMDRYDTSLVRFEVSEAELLRPDPRLVGLARDQPLHRGMVVLRVEDEDRERAAAIQAARDPDEALALLRGLARAALFGEALARVVARLEGAARRDEVGPLLGEFRRWPELTERARRDQVAVRLATGEAAPDLGRFLEVSRPEVPDRLHAALVDQVAAALLARGDPDGAVMVLGPPAADPAGRILPSARPAAGDPRLALVEGLLAAGRGPEADRHVNSQAALLASLRHRGCSQGFHPALEWYRDFVRRPENSLLRDRFQGAARSWFADSLEGPGACPDVLRSPAAAGSRATPPGAPAPSPR